MDFRPPGSSVHWIFQARILEWVVISFSRGTSWLRDWTRISCTGGRFSTDWATREALCILNHHTVYLKNHIYSICGGGVCVYSFITSVKLEKIMKIYIFGIFMMLPLLKKIYASANDTLLKSLVLSLYVRWHYLFAFFSRGPLAILGFLKLCTKLSTDFQFHTHTL